MENDMDKLQGKVIAEEKVVNKNIEETKKECITMKDLYYHQNN